MKKNIGLWIVGAIGVILFGIIAFVISTSSSTIKAVVPSQTISSGTVVTSDMLKEVDIPSNTPSGYITDPDSIVGQKLKYSVQENQLLYPQNIMASWRDSKDEYNIPDDYVVTSIKIPQDRAVAGMISVGDYIDLIGVPNSTYLNSDMAIVDQGLGDMAKNKYQANGTAVYWVLSNVRVLETNAVNISGVSGSGTTDGSASKDGTSNSSSTDGGDYYIVALSYSDYEKLQLAQTYLDLWANIVPEQNETSAPLLGEMGGAPTEINDAQAMSKVAKKADGSGNSTEPAPSATATPSAGN